MRLFFALNFDDAVRRRIGEVTKPLREAAPATDTPPVTGRTRARRRLRPFAVLLNVVLLGAGLYFQAHPRDRHDLWSAGGVAAVAIVNSASLTISRRGQIGEHFVLRLQRIALFANTLLLAIAVRIVALSALRDCRHAVLHGVTLVLPPLLTIVALRRSGRTTKLERV